MADFKAQALIASTVLQDELARRAFPHTSARRPIRAPPIRSFLLQFPFSGRGNCAAFTGTIRRLGAAPPNAATAKSRRSRFSSRETGTVPISKAVLSSVRGRENSRRIAFRRRLNAASCACAERRMGKRYWQSPTQRKHREFIDPRFAADSPQYRTKPKWPENTPKKELFL